MEKISVVIPVKNSKETIRECIDSVKRACQEFSEIVVVDDNSTDGSIDIAGECGCRIVKSEGDGGVAAARNTGVKNASGEIILFIDSDIILKKNAFDLLKGDYEKKGADAVVGVQSKELRITNFCSQYKNLWMRYTYERLPDYVPLFYTSIASIRKDIFMKAGGFDTKYRMPNVEDTEFGQRLMDCGFRVYLDRNLEVEHLKYYNLNTLLKTDFYRSSGLIKMVIRRGMKKFFNKNDTSVPSTFIVQLPFSLLFSVLIFHSAVSGNIFSAVAGIVSFIIFYILNSGFIFYLKKEKGIIFAWKSLLFLFIDAYWILAGMVYGVITYYLFGKRYY